MRQANSAWLESPKPQPKNAPMTSHGGYILEERQPATHKPCRPENASRNASKRIHMPLKLAEQADAKNSKKRENKRAVNAKPRKQWRTKAGTKAHSTNWHKVSGTSRNCRRTSLPQDSSRRTRNQHLCHTMDEHSSHIPTLLNKTCWLTTCLAHKLTSHLLTN